MPTVGGPGRTCRPPGRGARRLAGGLVVAVACAVLPAVAQGLAPATVVSISFSAGTSGAPITSVANDGSGATKQTVLTANGGSLVARWSGINSGLAADFPAYDGASTGARAVVAVANATGTDSLTPGAHAFRFGADARLDSSNAGTSYDNGNNLVQRGLFGAPAQFKVQADGRYYSCRVKGDKGSIELTSSLQITYGGWYRISCARQVTATGDRLVLKVAPVNADGTSGTVTKDVSAVSAIGTLSFPLSTPLSIGGKLANATTIAAESDQYNGIVDSVFLEIG